MTLLEPPVETSNKSRPLKFVAGALVVLAAVALYFAFRYYPERTAWSWKSRSVRFPRCRKQRMRRRAAGRGW